MKTQTIIQIIVILFIFLIVTLISMSVSLLTIELEQDKQAKPCVQEQPLNIQDLPKVSFNWTPINERTEQPKPLPVIHFNQLEK